MTTIRLDGFICETKFGPTDKPAYSFHPNEVRTQYTCSIMAYSFDVELPKTDTTAAHIEAIDAQIKVAHLKHADELAILKQHKERWLALDNDLREPTDISSDDPLPF